LIHLPLIICFGGSHDGIGGGLPGGGVGHVVFDGSHDGGTTGGPILVVPEPPVPPMPPVLPLPPGPPLTPGLLALFLLIPLSLNHVFFLFVWLFPSLGPHSIVFMHDLFW
jgi:hypothetical protein